MTQTIEGELLPVPQKAAPVANWTPSFAVSVDEAVAQVQAKHDFFRRVMREGDHYGVIPGTSTKPALFKPGAELLLSNMGLRIALSDADAPTVDYGEDGREGLIRYRRICQVYRQTGPLPEDRMLVAQAEGSCSSRETKYRYRSSGAACPQCGQPLRMSKDKPEWYCWAKKGGCGKVYPAAQFTFEKVPNPDLADVENTILKMADKRALVAATLLATGCSDIFTQDIDDFGQAPEPEPQATPPAAARRSQPVARVPQDELLALAHSCGLDGVKALGAWCVAEGIAPDLLTRERKTLTNEETQTAKKALLALAELIRADMPRVGTVPPETDWLAGRRLPDSIAHDIAKESAPQNARNAPSQPAGEAQDRKMTPKTQGRLFALLDERLSTEKEARLTFAAEHGIVVESFSALAETQARTLIRQLEMIPPPREDDADDILAEMDARGLFK
jgi:hypothetical protein